MKKLRLLLFEKCDRRCPGCCNKDWDLQSLPALSVPDLMMRKYRFDEIILTGGEPLLEPELVEQLIYDIKEVTNVPIILYTAKLNNCYVFFKILNLVDGITLTLHTQRDSLVFGMLNDRLLKVGNEAGKSLRLNIFKGIDTDGKDLSMWKVKKDIVWIKDCPLPEGEELYRLYGGY